MSTIEYLSVTLVSGLYTSLWGAYKDAEYEGFNLRSFPRSIYLHLVIFLLLFNVPPFHDMLQQLGLVQVFFLIMGIERLLTEIYKGFFRIEDQQKYLVPSRFTFFGRDVPSDPLRCMLGLMVVTVVVYLFCSIGVYVCIENFWSCLLVATGTGFMVSLGGAYKDSPFEGFVSRRFLRSAIVLLIFSPLLFILNVTSATPAPLGFLIFISGGIERFLVEYYKAYVQRNKPGKFHPKIPRDHKWIERREPLRYAATVIVIGVTVLFIFEVAGGLFA